MGRELALAAILHNELMVFAWGEAGEKTIMAHYVKIALVMQGEKPALGWDVNNAAKQTDFILLVGINSQYSYGRQLALIYSFLLKFG